MTVTLSLPPELDSLLRETAAAAGKDVAALVREAVEEMLTRDRTRPPTPGGASGADADTLPYGEWKRRFDSWMEDVGRRATRYPDGFAVDDSRDSIYEGRGE